MTLSVIVPTYCMTPAIADLWRENAAALRRVQSVPTELLVIDNGSVYPPEDATVRWPENRGIAPAWNEGRRRATGELLAFVTLTTTVTPGWDAKLCAVAQSSRVIAMPYTNGAKPYGLGIAGWCWVIRRDLADEIGPFDETFVPVQYEDTDFFWRAIRDHGVELVNVRGAHVQKYGSKVTLETAPWAARVELIHWANRLRFSWKHATNPQEPPPFWQTPLRDVEAPMEVRT